MANEIKLTPTVVYENGALKYTYQPGTVNLPQTTKGFVSKTIAVTTAEADIAMTEVGTPGYLLLHSLEATTTGNSVNYGPKSSTGALPADALMFKLKPKAIHFACMASSTCTLRWKVPTAGQTVRVQTIYFDV